jgi:acyl-CoA thioesterase
MADLVGGPYTTPGTLYTLYLHVQITPIHMNYQKNGLGAALDYEYTTMSMDFDFRTDPATRMEWILNRATTYKLEGGRYDMHIQMVDEKGNLVATVHQSNLVSERGRRKAPKTKSLL